MSVILYCYGTSPYSKKTETVLLLKNIRHEKVIVANMLPRSEITDLLGIVYRQIPLLAIGNDIYCDTSLIASILERRFPASQGYGTIFPNKKGGGADTGLIKVFDKHYVDVVLFPLGLNLVPFDKIPPAFVADRATPDTSAKKLVVRCPPTWSISWPVKRDSTDHKQSLVEEQLSDGREWLFDTELPSLADASVHFVSLWIKGLPSTESLFDVSKFPQFMEWLSRMTAYIERLKAEQPPVLNVTGEDAAARIVAASFEPYNVVGFDECEATRLGLKAGDKVSVGADEIGKDFRTTGTLVALNREEFVIEVQGSAGLVRCHFPRILFNAAPVS
ncbi:hypothetical protein B0H16DRAFT_1781529 [Mycena metata]|uniref:GST N-terminal domain-containing protein n=1 Tax=Mycena metata TaxID=1033252 RepID=A0AAD7HS22_9AGAR|nr:hypothetical protein B0H16DRAFT_1781529 [Mycena metata]